MPFEKGHPKYGGRPPNGVNKITRGLREMVLDALDRAGGIDYLTKQSIDDPRAFLSLVGRCVPQEVKQENTGEQVVTVYIRTGVPPPKPTDG